MFDSAAPSLPERTLPEFLADAGGFIGALAEEIRPEERSARLDEGLAGHGAANAAQPLVANHLDEGVEVVFGFQFSDPAAVHGAAGEAGDANLGDFHVATPSCRRPRLAA